MATIKPKVGFFDFTCCEGCQLQVVNLEEQIVELAGKVDIVEFREALTGNAPLYDIAFIEGSISREEDEKRLRDIRLRSKFLVAFGTCATSGGVNKLKNRRGDLTRVRKEVYGDGWNMPHLTTCAVKAVDEVVKVDVSIPGCPINKKEFVSVVKTLLMGCMPELPDFPVCVECKMLGNVCLYDKGMVCLGPITRAGCEAICPSNNASCEGCRGTVPNPNKNSMHEVLAKSNMTVDEMIHMFTTFAIDPEVK